MEKNRPVIVGVGELLWDMLPTGKRAGGAPVNFVYHAACMGADGYAISAIGKDELGKEVVRELDDNRIKHSLGIVDYPTGTVEVVLKDGNPTYNIIQDVAWDHIPLTVEAEELVKKADAVCFGTLAQRSPESRETIQTLLKNTRKEALLIFDINIRQSYYSKELIEEMLERANVFKVNDEEMVLVREMFGLDDDEDTACRQLLERYSLLYMILTAGSAYSSVYTAKEKSMFPTPKVKVVDTVGAGDSFSGAFVYSILCGKSLQEAHRIAVETAAYVCEREGAWPQYPFMS